MKYVVTVGGERVEVILDDGRVKTGGAELSAHLADVEGTPVQLVTIGNTVHRVVVERGEGKGSYLLWIDGWRFPVEALDERTRTIRDMTAKSGAASGPAPLVAPMPGLIVRVLAKVGDLVQAGQPLLVLEAMKMENELRCQAAGRVEAIKVSTGQAVEKGTLLVTLSPVS